MEAENVKIFPVFDRNKAAEWKHRYREMDGVALEPLQAAVVGYLIHEVDGKHADTGQMLKQLGSKAKDLVGVFKRNKAFLTKYIERADGTCRWRKDPPRVRPVGDFLSRIKLDL